MSNYLIKNTSFVNNHKKYFGDILIKNGRFEKMGGIISNKENFPEIDGFNKTCIPGCIDDQVHFREPGLTNKATIASESKAAVAGGITSFMEMPNTYPPTLSQQLLEEKYSIAAETSLANYSFYMGVSNDNIEEVIKTNEKKRDVCGIKIFMGSSTGNLLVDNPLTLERIFESSELLIATHCEDENIIKSNLSRRISEQTPIMPSEHALIRSEEACFEASFRAIQLALRHDARLHILHISTQKELPLFGNMLPLEDKRITSEACVHHLHFTSDDYAALGNKIKCNPAIKAANNKKALWDAVLDNRIDIIATDHAPHTLEEKGNEYQAAHSGLPLVQHSLLLMLEYVSNGTISLEQLVYKMCHAPAICFNISSRGFIEEGFWADLVIIDDKVPYTVIPENILYKCGWSPLMQSKFQNSIDKVFINGSLVFNQGNFNMSPVGKRLCFLR